jgi:predicted nucleotide-binding protein (sugar kinase/HSP70/actin superfamily)
VKVAVPRVGSLNFLVEDLCARLGLDFVETPAYNDSTIERGVAIAPEFLCFSMKVLLGSTMDALEGGADTILTAATYDSCRINYFGEIQKRILEREGYDCTLIVFDYPQESIADFYRNLKTLLKSSDRGMVGAARQARLSLHKARCYDEINRNAMALRALETQDGLVDGAVRESRSMLSAAWTAREIEKVGSAIARRFAQVPIDPERPHLKIGVTGEVITSNEPYFNLDIERWLAARGAVVERSFYISDLLTPMGRNPVSGRDDAEVGDSAKSYLRHPVGGHGHLNVAAGLDFAHRGFDAVVHFFPFACLPEVLTKTIFARVSKDLDIPILSLSIDEQAGRAGLQTRLEALLDIAWSRKRATSRSCPLRVGSLPGIPTRRRPRTGRSTSDAAPSS